MFDETPWSASLALASLAMAVTTKPTQQLSRADAFMLRMLRLPAEQSSTSAAAQSAFQKSIMISSVRCLLTYVFLPFVAPTIGIFSGVGPLVGTIVSLIAMFSIGLSMRRFWSSRHPQRWTYTVLGGTMFCFLIYLLIDDLAALI